MLGSTLFHSLLLVGLCCRAASQPGPCFSLFRYTNNCPRCIPCRQCRQTWKLSRASWVCSYVISCTVPTAGGEWLRCGMRKHNYITRTHRTVSRGAFSPAGMSFHMEVGTACEIRRNRGSNASQRISNAHVNYTFKSLGNGSATLLKANASTRNSQGDLGQSQDCDASWVKSSTPKGVDVGLQGPIPSGFVGMLISQLEGTTSSSDALKVAFSKRCDRVSFRDRVLSSLRQNAICTGLGITDNFAQDEKFILPNLRSGFVSGEAETSQEETVTRKGDEGEKQGISDRNVVASFEKNTPHHPTGTGRDCPLASRACRKPPLQPEYTDTVEGIDTPSSGRANSTHASNRFKTTGAALAHAETSSKEVHEGSECSQLLKGFQFIPRERRAASRHLAGGKPHSLPLPRSPNGRGTASESLRRELGLHHRSDILVQHITDLRRPMRLLRGPRTVRRRKLGLRPGTKRL